MGRMVAATLRDGPAAEDAHQRHERRIENGNEHHHHRRGDDDENRPRPAVVLVKRQNRQRVAQEERATVAHEDRRRFPVEDEKAEKRSSQRRADSGERHLLQQQEECALKQGHDDRHPAREPIHVVEEVRRVGDADDPEEAQRLVEDRKGRPGKRRAKRDGDARDERLARQFGIRLQWKDVVDQPEAKHRRGPGENRPLMEVGQRRRKCDKDAHATGERNRTRVPTLCPRDGDEPYPPRERTHGIRRGQPEGGRHDENGQNPDPVFHGSAGLDHLGATLERDHVADDERSRLSSDERDVAARHPCVRHELGRGRPSRIVYLNLLRFRRLPRPQASAAPARSVLRGASLACTVTRRVLGRHTPNTMRPGTGSCTWTISMFST